MFIISCHTLGIHCLANLAGECSCAENGRSRKMNLYVLGSIRYWGSVPGPQTGSTQAALFVVQVQDGFIPPDEFISVERPVEVLAGIVADVGFHPRCFTRSTLLPGSQQPNAVIIAQGEPTHIGFIAIFLRHDVRHVLFIHRPVVQANRGALVAVYIVFMRSAAEPLDLLETFGQRHSQTEARQWRHLLADHYMIVDQDIPAAINGVDMFVFKARRAIFRPG